MHLVYENTKEEIIAIKKTPVHRPPHLHNALEIVYVTEGCVELGVGEELFHMNQGDIGFIFPNIIHHYQVFSCQRNQAIYLNASPFLVDRFTDILENKAPKPPVIKASSIEPDVYHAFNSILGAQKDDITLVQAYLQIILARCIPKFQLVDKKSVGSTDLIYRTVSYVSGNFKHSITLESMARDLGVSKYVLSRIFSKTFHKNFNQYLNDARLGYACQRLENTNDTITELCLDSGFKSLRTFNRAFKEKFKTTPSEYRKTFVRNWNMM